MASVTHASRTVIDDSEGGFNFAPGVVGQEVQMIRLARSTKLRAKDLGKAGCSLSLTVDFVGTESAFNSFKNRIEGLYDMTIGDLDVPGSGSYDDCLFVGTPSFSEQIALQDNEYLYTVTMELIQL